MRAQTLSAAAAALSILVAAGGWNARAAAQTSNRPTLPLVIPSLTGEDLFRFYCTTCHGRDGKGYGPVASALKTPPADLTTIARRNGGQFPRDRVERFVTGERQPASAHGSMEMPVWGPIFQALDPQDTLNRIRIENVVSFIESIQVK
jgi:mono/diheme cytochrome c family protein